MQSNAVLGLIEMVDLLLSIIGDSVQFNIVLHCTALQQCSVVTFSEVVCSAVRCSFVVYSIYEGRWAP